MDNKPDDTEPVVNPFSETVEVVDVEVVEKSEAEKEADEVFK